MRVLLHVEQADGTRERIEWPAGVTLESDSRWVTVEACPGCRCVILNDGEGFTLDAVLDAGR